MTAGRMQRSSTVRNSSGRIWWSSSRARASLIAAGRRSLPTWCALTGGVALALNAVPSPGVDRERAPVDDKALRALQETCHQREHALGLIDLDRVRRVPDVDEVGPRQAALQELHALLGDNTVGGAVQYQRELVDRGDLL